jgi:VWFA-related protein
MYRLLAVPILALGLVGVGLGQSGRRPVPTPTPTSRTEQIAVYSESVPQIKRPPRTIPTFSGGTASTGSTVIPVKNDGELVKPETISDDDDVVKVETNLITIPVSVFDRNGLYIPGLEQGDFKIFEDGVEQEIAYFGTSDKPFTVVLLIDTSPSTEYKIEEIRRAAIAFVDQLKQQDQVMVIEFDSNVHVLTDVTRDRQRIYNAINRADFGGGTSLYEAVDVTLRRHLGKIEGRKAVVLFTDGVDTTSRRANYDSTLDLAEESDSLIFPIYYNTFLETARNSRNNFPFPDLGGIPAPGTTAREYAVGRKYLEELAGYTGGRVFRPESTPGGLTRAFEGIAEELRRQYSIGYVPAKDGTPGQRKSIKVRVSRPNLVIRARDSYIVGNKAK